MLLIIKKILLIQKKIYSYLIYFIMISLENSFKLNEKNEVVVFTDGACSNNGQNGASAGAGVWFGNNHPLYVIV